MNSVTDVRRDGGALGVVVSKRGALAATLTAFVLVAACNSSTKAQPLQCQTPKPEVTSASDLIAADASAACTDPGEPTPGPADMHCDEADGGELRQVTDQSACCGTSDAASDDSGGEACNDASIPMSIAPDDGTCCTGTEYGPTMYGQQGSDDDCKYDVSWTSTPLCLNGPVYFTVHANKRAGATTFGGGAPLTGAAPFAEVILNCGMVASAVQPPPVESPPGVYQVGPIVFPVPGIWSVRFHFNEECYDELPDSPHGHAAFWVTVPAGGAGGEGGTSGTPEASTGATSDATLDAPAVGTSDAASTAADL
jgi:hypothetical protein